MAGALEVFKKTNDETTDALRRQQEERARRVAAIRGMAEEVGTLKSRLSEVVRASSERIAKACPPPAGTRRAADHVSAAELRSAHRRPTRHPIALSAG